MSTNRPTRRTGPAARLAAVLLSLGLLSAAAGSRADDRVAIETLDPAYDTAGSVFNVYGTTPLEPGRYTLTLFGSYARKPLSVERDQTGEEVGDLIGSIGTLTVTGGIGITDRIDVGVAMPFHRVSPGDLGSAPPAALSEGLVDSNELALGDVRLVPRAQLLSTEGGIGVAALVPVYLPTGDDDVYAGEPLRVEPRLSVDWTSPGGVRVAGNLGYLVRSEAQVLGRSVDDMVRLGVGAEVPLGIVDGLSALAEVDSQVNVFSDDLGRTDFPTEGLLGLRLRHAGFLAQLGGGPGLVRGLGAPQYRLFAAVGFSPEPNTDGDGDGLASASDECPTEPEDRDGFEDHDGCPDPDNDGDTIADSADQCPAQAEDRDGFEDSDGCPDPDNDGDSVADGDDRCPTEHGAVEEAGCPAAPAAVAIETEQRQPLAALRETLHFPLNESTLETHAKPLLDEVAATLEAHPEITRVRIDGHADNRGPDVFNRRLSRRRARAVAAALVERGIAPERLSTRGFGSKRPLAPNDSDEHRALNRRVEFRAPKQRSALTRPASSDLALSSHEGE